MQVVLFGHGYMGKLIYRFLEKNPLVKKIYIVDPNPKCPIPNNAIHLEQIDDLDKSDKIDAAFIATNSVTHASVLEQTIHHGIKNIFCEKPMCLEKKEYEDLFKIMPDDTKVVVDYILRSSKALHAVQNKMAELKKDGWILKSCNINYGKDKTKDPRRFRDVGVYEELYHVWDLCFNGPLFGKLKKITTQRNIFVPDEEIKNRCIEQRFNYMFETEKNEHIPVHLHSSFQMKQKIRSFCFFFNKGTEKCVVALNFDLNNNDQCLTVDSNSKTHEENFPANTKLENQINDTLIYFKTGEKAPYFHDAYDSYQFHCLLENMGQLHFQDNTGIIKRITNFDQNIR